MRILLNAVIAKKRSGGGFQVCINFILKTLEQTADEWYYVVSDELDQEVGVRFMQLRGTRYFHFTTQPDFLHSYWQVRKELKRIESDIRPDIVFSILAPSYFRFSTTEVMRYTFPWVTHPNRFAWASLPFKSFVRIKLYCIIQRRLMRKAHYFITQSETCAKGIRKVTRVPMENVAIIPNVLPATFTKFNVEHIDSAGINIVCVGSAYYHKNIDIVPEVIKLLRLKGYNDVVFHLTLPQESNLYMLIINKAKQYGVGNAIINHGTLSQTELGEVYRRCDYSFIPTLLEVFSASTVEAMWFGLPMVATNYGFNRDVLGNSCLYYEPLNAQDAADQFSILFENAELRDECKRKMGGQMNRYWDFDAYFNNTTRFLKNVADKTHA